MKKAPFLDCLLLYPFSSWNNGAGSAEIVIGRYDVVEALVVKLVDVALDAELSCRGNTARCASTAGTGCCNPSSSTDKRCG